MEIRPADLLILLLIVAVMNIVISMMVFFICDAYLDRRASDHLFETEFHPEPKITYQDGKNNRAKEAD